MLHVSVYSNIKFNMQNNSYAMVFKIKNEIPSIFANILQIKNEIGFLIH